MHFPTITLATLSLLPSALGAFHLMTRYERDGTYDCSKGKTCACSYNVEWRMGAVPSQNYNCNAFKNDQYFARTIGEGGSWDHATYPSICGSNTVDMYVVDGGNGLEVWEKGAPYPGNRYAKCYRQADYSAIGCGNGGDPLCPVGNVEVHDTWVCADTNLCS